MKKRIALIAAAAVLLAATVVGILHFRKGSGSAQGGVLGFFHASSSKPAPGDEPIPFHVGDRPALPSAWLEVHDPGKLWAALRQNGWLKQVMAEPLGEGFVGSWAAFLGSRGEDLEASFKGEVTALIAEKLLADPFRLVWYAGEEGSGAPALVVSSPSRSSRAAFEALDQAVRRGSLVASRCPGAKEETKGGEKKPLTVFRWLIAEHAVFAGASGDRIVLSRQPQAALQGLCAVPERAQRPAGVDLELALAKEGFGPRAAALGDLAGLGPSLRLLFRISDATVAPVGIAGELREPLRLAAVAPPAKLLSAIPADTGVLLTLALQLPAKLDLKAVEAVFAGKSGSSLATRQVTLAWNPHGADSSPAEVAVLWSAPADRTESDRVALREIFSGSDPLEWRTICSQEVFASSKRLLERMERACSGKEPSLLNGPPSVKAGLQEPASIGLGVNLGRVLSVLVEDAARAEQGDRPPAPEIESAKRLLEELPFMGLRGVAREKALVPGGYRS